MKIVNQDYQELQPEDIDLQQGFIRKIKLSKIVSPAIPEKPAVTKRRVKAVFFLNGEVYFPNAEDAHIQFKDGHFCFQPLSEDEAAEFGPVSFLEMEQVEVEPAVPGTPAVITTEEARMYIEYTPEERKAQAREKNIQALLDSNTPQQIAGLETAVNDLTLSIAEMLGA